MKPGQLRRAMIAGIVFVILFVVGALLMFTNTPETKSSETAAEQAQKWVTELSSSSNRTGLIVGGYLLIFAGLAYVWFTNGLRGWIGRDDLTGRAIMSLGVLGAGAIFAAAMMGTAVAGAVAFGNEALPQNGDVIRIVMGLLFPFLFVVFAVVSAALIVVVALAGRAAGQLPSWLFYTAVLGVLGAVFSVIGPPVILMLLWLLALSIVGLVRARSPAAAA